MNAVELDEARTAARRANRAELLRLARHAELYPNGDAFYQVMKLSTLDRVSTAVAFDRARNALARGYEGLAQHEFGAILGCPSPYAPGTRVRMESWGGCPSCGARTLTVVGPCGDRPDASVIVRCDRTADHVSGGISWGSDWVTIKGSRTPELEPAPEPDPVRDLAAAVRAAATVIAEYCDQYPVDYATAQDEDGAK